MHNNSTTWKIINGLMAALVAVIGWLCINTLQRVDALEEREDRVLVNQKDIEALKDGQKRIETRVDRIADKLGIVP